MQRCSSTSSQGHVMGSCPCGLYHTQTNSPFSMLFSMPTNHQKPYDQYEPSDYHYHNMYSSVDCTLSLGTPSTRLTSHDVIEPNDDNKRNSGSRRSSVSNFCWDILQPKSSNKSFNGNRGASNSNNGDSLLARRCANCDTTSTPLWRNGPRGPKSLCNACGIRFKKEERRASAAATSSHCPTSSGSSGHSWMSNSQQAQKMHCYAPSMNSNEFRFIDDQMTPSSYEPGDGNGVPFLSWRLNVTDRPSLVHDFTR